MSIESISSSQSTATSTTNDRATLDKDGFLKLFIEQLKNQDPMSPMDEKDFTAQMAQFSTVEQLTNLSKSAEKLLEYQSSLSYSLDSLNQAAYNHNSLVNYSNLIGKEGYWLDEAGSEQSGQIQSIISKSNEIYAMIDGREIPTSMLHKLEVGI